MHLERQQTYSEEICEPSSPDGCGDTNEPIEEVKACRFCYAEGCGESDEWLRPCKCNGSMLWVHKDCFNAWLRKASGKGKMRCEICGFVYRKMWLLKPWEEWSFPELHLSLVDVLELLFDAFIVYRIKYVHTMNRRTSLLTKILRTSYILHRFGFYARVFSAVGCCFFEVITVDAV